MLDDAMKVANPSAIERRVLTFTDPNPDAATGSTTTNLSTALQILLPGEKARPHRHTMNALRFVIEGSGASTVVDGKDCPMEEGDLVITPGWTWHEHVHRGDKPIIWLDALDAPLHRYLGTDKFEPGPAHDLPTIPADAAFAFPNIVPELAEAATPFSPVFRYPWAQASAAVRAAPEVEGRLAPRALRQPDQRRPDDAADGLLPHPDRQRHRDRPLPNHQQCGVPGLRGPRRHQGRRRHIAWEKRDVFSLPHGNWITHKADETSTLFLVTDRDALHRLDLLKEQYGNEF